MMGTEDDKQKRIDKLEAQVAALTLSVKAANKQYEGSVLKYGALEQKYGQLDADHSKALEDHSKTLEEHSKTLGDYNRLLAFVDSLKENISIDKCMLWAAKSEKLTNKDLIRLRKDLAEQTLANPERMRDVDLAEADAPPPASNDAVISEILAGKPEKGKKKWGRQPGVRTCGRDMSSFDALPRHEVTNDLREVSDAEYAASLTFIKTEKRNQLDYVKAYYRNKVTITHLYSDQDGKVVFLRNKISPDFVKGGKLTNGAAAAIVADKVLWGLPIYRQAKRINMINGSNIVEAQILNSYFLAAGDLVTPIWEDLLSYIKGQKAIHGDETRLLCIHNTEKGKSALGYVWALSYQGKDHPASFFRFYTNRASSCAQELFGDCRGLALQADGYAAYASVVRDINENIARTIRDEEGEAAAVQFLQDVDALLEKGVVLVGCLAHSRRKVHTCFEAIYKKHPDSEGFITCNTILGLIGKLYEIEETLRAKRPGDNSDEAEFLARRKELAEPVLASLEKYAKERVTLHPTEKKLEMALNYLLNQMQYLKNYLVSSELTCDNNFQEREIKTFVISRKNSLFASTERGALAWTKLMTVMQTAILNKCDPTLYLKFLLDKITVIMNSEAKAKDIDWSQFRPWNLTPEQLEQAWDA